jgi:hypothetical protein
VNKDSGDVNPSREQTGAVAPGSILTSWDRAF